MSDIKTKTAASIEKHIGIKVDDLSLTMAELRFVREVCTRGFDYGKAHEVAGYVASSPTEHMLEGRKIASKPEVAEAINRFIDIAIGPYVKTLQYEALGVLRGMATWKPQDFYNDDGSVKPLDEIPEEKLYAIEGMVDKFYGKDAQRKVRELKLSDRRQAWNMLLSLKKEYFSDDKKVAPDKDNKLRKILNSINDGTKKEVKVTERMRTVLMRDAETPEEEQDDDEE